MEVAKFRRTIFNDTKWIFKNAELTLYRISMNCWNRVSKVKSEKANMGFGPDTFKIFSSKWPLFDKKVKIFGEKSRFSEKCQNPPKRLFWHFFDIFKKMKKFEKIEKYWKIYEKIEKKLKIEKILKNWKRIKKYWKIMKKWKNIEKILKKYWKIVKIVKNVNRIIKKIWKILKIVKNIKKNI